MSATRNQLIESKLTPVKISILETYQNIRVVSRDCERPILSCCLGLETHIRRCGEGGRQFWYGSYAKGISNRDRKARNNLGSEIFQNKIDLIIICFAAIVISCGRLWKRDMNFPIVWILTGQNLSICDGNKSRGAEDNYRYSENLVDCDHQAWWRQFDALKQLVEFRLKENENAVEGSL